MESKKSDKTIERLRLVREVILDSRRTRDWSRNPKKYAYGCCGILDFVETGDIDRIAVSEIRDNVKEHLKFKGEQ